MRRWLAVALLWLGACAPERHVGVGTVKEVRPDLAQIVLDHEAIAGVMGAMTMNFDAAPALLAGLAAGDRVRFELDVREGRYRIVGIERLAAGTGLAAGAQPAAGAGLAAVPPEEDVAPPFSLTDQDGRPLALAALRGKWVLLDFVYTTCPGPCPVLTATRVRVQRELPAALRPRVWFVSISLDPEHDTPEALRAYAAARGADLTSWSFLTGPPADVAAVLEAYGVGAVRDPSGKLEHVVVTLLIDPGGHVHKRYFGLDHSAADYVRDLSEGTQTGA